MSTTCENHALEPDEHCEEMERMLEELPGDFCEGEGDSPADAVRRLANAYEEAKSEVKQAGKVAYQALGMVRFLRESGRHVTVEDLDSIIELLDPDGANAKVKAARERITAAVADPGGRGLRESLLGFADALEKRASPRATTGGTKR